MTTIEIYSKYNYPQSPSISLLDEFGERYTSFEAMLLKKAESLKKYAENENSSHFLIDKETEELWNGYETLDYMASLYEKTIKQIDEDHFYNFSTWMFGPVQFEDKMLREQINILKSELNIV